jgi:hypothetical protein
MSIRGWRLSENCIPIAAPSEKTVGTATVNRFTVTEEMSNFLKLTSVSNEKEALNSVWRATVQRNRIYFQMKTVYFTQPNDFKLYSLKLLADTAKDYINHDDEALHLQNIVLISDKISKEFSSILHEGRFRLGAAQKLLNLYLKFLWCLGKVDMPTHLPLDSIVQKILPRGERIRWTKMDDLSEYEKTIHAIRLSIGNRSLPEWELCFWNQQRASP